MATRNFWIEANVDGRSTTLAGGPRSKDGGFSMTVYIRERGGVKTALNVRGYESNGKLELHYSEPGGPTHLVETER